MISLGPVAHHIIAAHQDPDGAQRLLQAINRVTATTDRATILMTVAFLISELDRDAPERGTIIAAVAEIATRCNEVTDALDGTPTLNPTTEIVGHG